MKPHLMYLDRDFLVTSEPRAEKQDLIQDLELDTIFDAMANGDKIVRAVAHSGLLSCLTEPQEIVYRQRVLNDCLQNPVLVREMHDLAIEAIRAERDHYLGFFTDRPSSRLYRAITLLPVLAGKLKRLREFADEQAGSFRSDGFTQFFTMLQKELDDEYFLEVDHHLRELAFHRGILVSAGLGLGNQGVDYILRQPHDENRTWLRRIPIKKPTFSLTVPERDQSGLSALAELRERGINLVANAAARSVDHILAFFTALRRELGFYLGCLTLHQRLSATGSQVSFPEARDLDARSFSAQALYDPCLTLRLAEHLTSNDIDADGSSLVMITGANQGGKSTFLRSIGLAQLMMQAGMYVCADSLALSVRRDVFTHYRREEDATMSSGKLDEELARMSEIADQITTGCLLLCNESFASTNEREGSLIARDVVRAMIDQGVEVCYVTHMFDLANTFYAERLATARFLRAEREDDWRRTFRVVVGEPLPTSYGQDLYRQTFPESRSPGDQRGSQGVAAKTQHKTDPEADQHVRDGLE